MSFFSIRRPRPAMRDLLHIRRHELERGRRQGYQEAVERLAAAAPECFCMGEFEHTRECPRWVLQWALGVLRGQEWQHR
jgi:hypothetical protein